MMAASTHRSLVIAIATVMALASCESSPTYPSVVMHTNGSEIGWWTIQLDKGTALDPQIPPPDHPVITIKADVFFDHGSSILKLSQTDALDDVAALIINNGRPVVLRGHTDDTGSAEYNMLLGADRAHSIQNHLIHALGVPSDLILSVESLGESCPADTNATPAGRSNNRRVEIYEPEYPPSC